jgi:hypothetical protein
VLKVLVRMLFTTSLAISACPLSYGQLPPTNMGKYVHQPGDNQYSAQTQSERHRAVSPARGPVSNPASNSVPQQQQRAAEPYHPVAAPPRLDYSIMPISCDEPLKPPGFPPLPDRLDFSNVVGFNRVNGFTGLGQSGSGAPSLSPAQGTSKGPPRPEGIHQHYVHYNPRAFVPESDQSHSNYKVTTPRSDYYNVNSPNSAPGNVGDSGSPPAFQSAAGNALKSMGPQPHLLHDQPVQPAAPSPVTVNQAVTQDLSLPEDQFSSGQAVNPNTTGKRMARQAGNLMYRTMYQVVNQGAGAASSMVRFR